MEAVSRNGHTPPKIAPLQNEESREGATKGAEASKPPARDASVTIRVIVLPAPAHTIFLLLEADAYEPVGKFLKAAYPDPSDFSGLSVIPMTKVAELVAGIEQQK